MNTHHWHVSARTFVLAAMLLTVATHVCADVVTEANEQAAIVTAKVPATPVAVRTMAIVQVSVFEAVNAITGRYPPLVTKLEAAPGASVDAAVAAATRAVLENLAPLQQTAIRADYNSALQKLPDGEAKTAGIAVGEQAAAAVIAARVDDGTTTPETYRPYTAPGVYVPTAYPAVPNWGKRKPWLMTSGNQFRPGPPPSLASELWVRDYNEIKALGAKNSTKRTPEQTDCARFWEATTPAIYWPVARCVANMPGREITENARLLAMVGMSMDDAIIAVFDAKYTYNFWRPVTAIRNGDLDSSDATERDAGWKPFIDTPMHPEYPCAHCIVSAALGAVLETEIGSKPTPKLSTASPTADGEVHTWDKVSDFVREVSESRICDGVHFRNSTEVGTAMGKQVGELAVKGFPRNGEAAGSPRTK